MRRPPADILKSALRRAAERIPRDRATGERSWSVADTLDPADRAIIERARPYTMISTERLAAVIDATAFVVARQVPGAVVECGVWRGGSVLAAIETLLRCGATDRDVYLFDTFEGMTEPGEADTSPFEAERSALASWSRARGEGRRAWDFVFRPEMFSLDQVKEVLYGTGYPAERIHFVVGPVERTIPDQAPDQIALLRLDTDWYESTRHELVHLYPRLSTGGVLIVDDYGHWEGARRAVDEYFAGEAPPLLLARTDYTGRMGLKI